MSNVIEKQIEVKAPLSRVWRALTDHNEFGEWFRVKLEGPFVPGKVTRGKHPHSGFRARDLRSDRAENGAGAAVLIHLASVCDRSEKGLLEGAGDAGRVHP